jgi:hypothetical protein
VSRSHRCNKILLSVVPHRASTGSVIRDAECGSPG